MATKHERETPQEARAIAKKLQENGTHHMDFMYFWYEDEYQVVSAQAFDEYDEPIHIKDIPNLRTLVWGVEYESNYCLQSDVVEGLYLYSPSAHRIIASGEVDFQKDKYILEIGGKDAKYNDNLCIHIPQFSPNYEDLLAALTWQPDIDEALLREYVQHDAVEVRIAIASNPNIPEDIAYILSEDVVVDVRKALAKLPALPLKLQRKLRQDNDMQVRTTLVSSQYTSSQILVDIWENLSQSEMADDIKLTYLAISNPNMPLNLLVKEYQSGDLAQARNLAMHPDLSDEIFLTLLSQEYEQESFPTKSYSLVHNNPYTLWSLLINHQELSLAQLVDIYQRIPNISVDYPEHYDNDKMESLYDEIARALRGKTMSDYKLEIVELVNNYPLSEESVLLYSNIVMDTSLSWSFICELGLDKIRLSRPLAFRGDVPRTFWENIGEQCTEPTEGEAAWLADARFYAKCNLEQVESKSIEERFADLRTYFTTPDNLLMLSDLEMSIEKDPYPTVILDECARGILAQGDSNVSVIENLEYLTELLVLKANGPHAALAQHPHYLIRKIVAASRRTPEDILAQLSEDKAWQVRMEIARNRFTPRAILEKFANDEHPAVQQALLQNLAAPRYLLQRMPEH